MPGGKTCPNCRQSCDRQSPSCPSCHYDFRSTSPAKVLGIVLLVFGAFVLLIVALAAFGIRSLVTSTGAYQDALEIVQASPEARKALGDSIRSGWPFGLHLLGYGSEFVEWSVPLSGSRGRARLYAVANLIGGNWEFSRLVIAPNRSSVPIDLTPAPQRLAMPPVPPSRIFLVPFGLEPSVSLAWAPAYYRAKFGIDVSVLPATQIDERLESRAREQLDSEQSLRYLQEKLPDLAADPSAVLIAVTSRDMYIPVYSWQYAENYRSDRTAIVSTARLHPASFFGRSNPQWFRSRVQKMITKNVAVMYFGLPLSADYTSLLSGGVLSGAQIDFMTGSIIGAARRWFPMQAGDEPGVSVYDVPGKPVLWRRSDAVLPLPDTSSQLFYVDIASGMLGQFQMDFRIVGKFPLEFTRTYTTLDQQSRAFGIGTDDSLDTFLVGQMGSYVDLCFADSGRIRFQHARQQSGQGDTYLPSTGDYTKAVFAANTWTVFRSDGAKFYFPFRPNARGEYVTVLTGFTDSSGHLYRIERNAAGDLLSITTPAGAWLRFQYDAAHRIRRIDSSTGRVVNYEYDPKGRLSRVTASDGHVESYTYDGRDEMLTAGHAPGPPLLTNSYGVRGFIAGQEIKDRGSFKYFYTSDRSDYRDVVVPTLMIDPNGLYTYFNYGRNGFAQSLPTHPPY